MFCICVLIIAAAAVYMVEAYIHTYYAIEYMHGAPLFFVLLAKYAAPVLFLLLCGYFAFRYREKRRESEKPAQEKPMNKEEVYAEKINATVKTKAVFSDQADQVLYQVKRFGQKMAVAANRARFPTYTELCDGSELSGADTANLAAYDMSLETVVSESESRAAHRTRKRGAGNGRGCQRMPEHLQADHRRP